MANWPDLSRFNVKKKKTAAESVLEQIFVFSNLS